MSARTVRDIPSTVKEVDHPLFGKITVETFHPGEIVICDSCGDDYTDSKESGGILFGSYAYCPKCAKRHLPNIIGYGEERFIKARCPEDKSYANWVREDLR